MSGATKRQKAIIESMLIELADVDINCKLWPVNYDPKCHIWLKCNIY
jgi:hypothetical protein